MKISKESIFNRVYITIFLFPSLAFADFQSSIQSLVTGVLGGILPAIVMYEIGLAGVSFAKKSPDAKDKAEAAALGALVVLGVNGVWSFLKGHIK
jgi:hypothetical protein